MKHRLSFLTSFLVIALLIVSCSPASATQTQETIVLPPTESVNESAPVAETTVPNVEATQVPVVESVATSRGDDLHATDPSTVSLASGQLQLVEFFRFT